MPHPLVIWSNAQLPDSAAKRLAEALSEHKVLQASSASANNLAAGNADPLLEQADVALGQPDPDQILRLPQLRWVQLTTAGYTRYDTSEFRIGAKKNNTIVCNASSVYADPCAQHILSMMLALNRRLPQSLENQRTSRDWPYLPLRAESQLLNGQTVVIVGYGAIGQRLAKLLAPFDMQIIAFRRNPKGDDGAVRVLPISELNAWLPKADHVINILPASDATEEFFNADRLPKIKKGAFYYNIGRGSTNDQYALQVELQTGGLSAAYIDAFMEEPLSTDHPLWSTPNCYITPHTAGGHATEYERHVDLFLENLKRFQSSKDLIDRII